MVRQVSSAVVFAVAMLCFVSPSAHAARLLEFTIEVDGKPVLRGIASDDGREEVRVVWGYLHRVEFELEKDAKIEINALDEAVLRGNVVVRIRHAQQTLSEARLMNLQLVRKDPNATRWMLPAAEVARATQAAGFPYMPPPTKANRFAWWVLPMLGLVTSILLLIAAGLRVWRRFSRRLDHEP